jgi:hypothetical protein
MESLRQARSGGHSPYEFAWSGGKILCDSSFICELRAVKERLGFSDAEKLQMVNAD